MENTIFDENNTEFVKKCNIVHNFHDFIYCA